MARKIPLVCVKRSRVAGVTYFPGEGLLLQDAEKADALVRNGTFARQSPSDPTQSGPGRGVPRRSRAVRADAIRRK